VAWANGLAVDNSGTVWVAALVGSSNPPTIPAYAKNSGALTPLTSATNVFSVRTDSAGNAYFVGTTGGTNVNATPMDSSWTPAVWKNGNAAPTSLSVDTGMSYGNADSLAFDAAGNCYVIGAIWGGTPAAPTGEPVYWKLSGGAWGAPVALNMGSYSSNINWYPSSVTIDGSGGLDATGWTWASGFPSTNGYWSASLIYWKGVANAPTLIALGSYTYFQIWPGASAVDESGNYYIAGSVATDASTPPVKSVPVYWKNGGSAIALPVGSIGSVANDCGVTGSIVVGP